MLLQLAIWCVAVPAVSMICGLLVLLCLQRFAAIRISDSLGPITIVLFWCIGVMISHFGRQSWELWPEAEWRRLLWPLLGTSILLAAIHQANDCLGKLRWPIVCTGIALSAFLTTPRSPGWEDVMPLHSIWLPLTIVSGFVNTFSLYCLIERHGTRWVNWVAVAGIAASLMYAMGAYAGLAEFILASLIATLTAALFASFERFKLAASVIYPATILTAVSTSSARYHSYDDPNPYIMAAVLFLPTMIVAVDHCVPKQRPWSRVMVSLLLAFLTLGILAWFLNPNADAS